MKRGDLIKHKRSNTIGIVLNAFENKKDKLATVFFTMYKRPSTASLKLLKDNWEIISDN